MKVKGEVRGERLLATFLLMQVVPRRLQSINNHRGDAMKVKTNVKAGPEVIIGSHG